MRCPKCGYISFDHLDTCNKCEKDLSGIVENFGGGLFSASSPKFLVMTPSSDSDVESSGDDFVVNTSFDDEYVDEELNILLDDEEEGEDDTPTISFADDEEEEDDDEGIAFDFSFDDDEEEEAEVPEPVVEAEEELSLSVPDELADISDLAPVEPGEVEEEDDDDVAFTLSIDDDEDDFAGGEEEVEIDLDNLDLELDSVMQATGDGKDDPVELSLNEIDFSEMGQTGGSPALNPDGTVDMDADLDFELDLGGLSLHKKEEKV